MHTKRVLEGKYVTPQIAMDNSFKTIIDWSTTRKPRAVSSNGTVVEI